MKLLALFSEACDIFFGAAVGVLAITGAIGDVEVTFCVHARAGSTDKLIFVAKAANRGTNVAWVKHAAFSIPAATGTLKN